MKTGGPPLGEILLVLGVFVCWFALLTALMRALVARLIDSGEKTYESILLGGDWLAGGDAVARRLRWAFFALFLLPIVGFALWVSIG